MTVMDDTTRAFILGPYADTVDEIDFVDRRVVPRGFDDFTIVETYEVTLPGDTTYAAVPDGAGFDADMREGVAFKVVISDHGPGTFDRPRYEVELVEVTIKIGAPDVSKSVVSVPFEMEIDTSPPAVHRNAFDAIMRHQFGDMGAAAREVTGEIPS